MLFLFCFVNFQVYGGDNIMVRFYRMYFQARTSLEYMWLGNPVLTTLIFGLPLGFLSLIFYSVCCTDILDAEEEETDGQFKPKHSHYRGGRSCFRVQLPK